MEKTNDYEDEIVYVDDSHYFPKYLLCYLNALGIKQGDNPKEFFFNGEKLIIKADFSGIKFFSKFDYNSQENTNLVARINCDSNAIYFTTETAGLGIRKSSNYDGVEYHASAFIHSVYSYGDMLGNVHIIYSNGWKSKEIVVRIGEEHKKAEDYLSLLKEQITKDIIYDPNALEIIHLMVDDPRVVNGVKNHIKVMAPDIDTAYERKVNELKAFYGDQLQEQMKKIYAIQDNAIAELTQFRDELLKRKKSK